MKKVLTIFFIIIISFSTISNFKAVAFEGLSSKTDNDIPDFIISEDGDKANNYIRLKENEKDLKSIVYIENGERVIRLYDTPIKYIDENGSIVDKSNQLVKKSIFEKYRYVVEQNDVKQYFPKKISDGIKIQYNNSFIVMRPDNNQSKEAIENKAHNCIEYNEVSPLTVGNNITQGTVVGKIGSTGNVTGPHLHMTVTTYYQGISEANTINPQLLYIDTDFSW